MIKHIILNNDEDSLQENQEEPKAWYETIWGLIILTVGLNVLSNFIYDRGRERLRLSDTSRERLREIDHLEKYHGRTEEQAEREVDKEEEKVDEEIPD